MDETKNFIVVNNIYININTIDQFDFWTGYLITRNGNKEFISDIVKKKKLRDILSEKLI